MTRHRSNSLILSAALPSARDHRVGHLCCDDRDEPEFGQQDRCSQDLDATFAGTSCQAVVVRDQLTSIINQSNRRDQGITSMASASRTQHSEGLGVVTSTDWRRCKPMPTTCLAREVITRSASRVLASGHQPVGCAP
jgi:hypothetical protein